MADEQMTQDRETADGQTPFLKKILGLGWAEMVVGNLLLHLLRDSTIVRGPTTRKSTSQDSLAVAALIFEDFMKLYPGFEAVNPSNIPLGIVIDDLAPKVCLDLKLHDRKLPETIRTKMENLVLDPADLLDIEQHAENNDGADGTTLDDDVNEENPRKKFEKIDFQPRHTRSY
ncbi:hypothetical protein BG015_003358 [Linnemannia schmuckeri]|uniref:Uncharacterized protein n=1 Tax=Linnemannia schmuckeri TaxID=64567 RepID=A0A9P5RL34_9FUNG|nr:hypothetical protein BG015_003358 [Linnemannia schmuckeri]